MAVRVGGFFFRILALAGLTAIPCASQVRVIVNEANSLQSLTQLEVSRIFLQHEGTEAPSHDLEPVDLPYEDPLREEFSQRIHRRSAEKVKVIWNREMFGGGASPPLILDDERAVAAYVRDHPRAIGYVSDGYVSGGAARSRGVKLLKILSAPVPLHRVQAEYPAFAQRAKIEGVVRLLVTIHPDGTQGEVEVLESPSELLTRAAKLALARWEFLPAKLEDEPVEGRTQIAIGFFLKD